MWLNNGECAAPSHHPRGEGVARRSRGKSWGRSRRTVLSVLLSATGLAVTQCASGGNDEPSSGQDARSSPVRSIDGADGRSSPRTTAPSVDEDTIVPPSPETGGAPDRSEDLPVPTEDGGEQHGAPPALTDDPIALLGVNVLQGQEFLQYSNAHGCYVGMYGHWLCDGGAVEIVTDTGSDITSVIVKNDHPMEPPLGVAWSDAPQDLVAKLGEPSTFHENYFYVWDQPDGTRFSVTYNMQGSDPNVDYLPFEIAHFQVDRKPDWVSY